MAAAYLIVICERQSNAILGAEIWSSPEWERGRQLDRPTYVVFRVDAETFEEAKSMLITTITHPKSRYYRFARLLIKTQTQHLRNS